MTDKDTSRFIPISLGKPSLRRRLEDYYTLIAPDQLSNPHEWLTKFNTIYNKFGGSQEGERTLANKLTKKYGTTVRLLLADSQTLSNIDTTTMVIMAQQRDEDWYTTKPIELGNVSFTSPTFDGMAALMTTDESRVEQINPFLTHQRLDNMSKFPHYLPTCDPCHRIMRIQKPLGPPIDAKVSNQPNPTSLPSLLVTMVEPCATGPLSVLHRCLLHRQRIRVMIRYINGIRASLTGYLIGFDVHFNLLMKDVLEVYNKNQTRDDATTPVMAEIHRRHHAMTHGVLQRQLRQLFVRGDMVVLCYPSDGERSVIPTTSKSPTKSLYMPQATVASVPTPGSLLYAYQRRHSKQGSSW